MASRTRLFVGNLPETVDQNDLKAAFLHYGEIISLDVKTKSGDESNNKKNFAFVTLSASNYEVESCIKHFSGKDFKGSQLYVTRARESFLERLQREREQEQNKKAEKKAPLPTKNPTLKINEKLNPRKRKLDSPPKETNVKIKTNKPVVTESVPEEPKTNSFVRKNNKKAKKTIGDSPQKNNEKISANGSQLPQQDNEKTIAIVATNGHNARSQKNKLFHENDKKKQDADKKRMESMRQKRQQFKEKQSIIKTSLIGIDKAPNKKIIFSDDDDLSSSKAHNIYTMDTLGDFKPSEVKKNNKKPTFLFDDDDGSGEDVSFDIKKQFEGKSGQKVLDLQSRYKSDKRFVLDERFIEEEQPEAEYDQDEDRVDLQQADEKAKQLNILQDVLGVAIRTYSSNDTNTIKKTKSKMGMQRFDPTQPDHAKFLAPVVEKPEVPKKSKKKNTKDEQQHKNVLTPQTEPPKIEVSKEKFYKVTETLKEAIAQPTTFSLRSLFGTNEEDNRKDEVMEQDSGYIPLEAPKPSKVKNPLDRGEKNPFVYDSSDSEPDEEEKDKPQAEPTPGLVEVKAVWKENLFFTDSDHRLKEGLSFFSKPTENEHQKERRELKSLMKKRIYNNERKNQMFQKKIGGKKKTMKKSYNKKKNNR